MSDKQGTAWINDLSKQEVIAELVNRGLDGD